MTTQTKKWIAGGLFAALTLLNLIDLVRAFPIFSDYTYSFSYYFLSFLDVVTVGLVAVGIFIGVDLLVAIGGGIQVLMSLYYIINNLMNLRYGVGDYLLLVLANLLWLLMWGLVAVTPFSKKAAPIAGIAAAAVDVVRFIVLLIRTAAVDYLSFGRFSFLFWVSLLLFIGGSLIAGLYYGERALKAENAGAAPSYAGPRPGAYPPPSYPSNPYGAPAQPNYPPQPQPYYPPQPQAGYPPQPQPGYPPQPQPGYPPQPQPGYPPQPNYPPQQMPQQQDNPQQQNQDF